MPKAYDVVVIGGGPGGYVAAIRAAQLGLSTAVVERENLGGVCLNWGCIPTKALLKASELHHTLSHAADYGFTVDGFSFDFNKVIERSRNVAGTLNQGVGYLMKKNKIDVIEGEATFSGAHELGVGKEKVSFKKAIVATGARPRQIPGVFEADGKLVWTSREAMTPDAQPKSLLVIGAGAIGVEFASFYQNMGTQVTLVETQDRLVPVEDAEISKLLEAALKQQGMTIHTGASVKQLKTGKNDVTANFTTVDGKPQEQKFDRVLLAIGVVGNTEGLGVDALGAEIARGAIKVDDMYRTGAADVYAIGDVAGAPWLAHVASHEGMIAAEHIASQLKGTPAPHAMDYSTVPGCTYCRPQIGSMGLTEAAAKEQGLNINVGRFNYQASGKAQAAGETEGLVKTIVDAETGELLGAHIIGAEATEMITTFVLGRALEATADSIAHACLPHPTLSEMLGESILDSMGRVVNA